MILLCCVVAVEGGEWKVHKTGQMQVKPADVPSKLEHHEIPYRKGQGAQKKAAQQVGGEDRLQHAEEGPQAMPGSEAVPSDIVPMDL